MNALKDKNRPDLTEQTPVNRLLNNCAAEEDPEFQLRELMRDHTDKLTDLHKVSLAKARDDARTVFEAAFKAHEADIAEAVKAAASSEDVLERLSGFNKTVEGVFKRFEEAEAKVAAIAETFKRSARLAYVIHGLMLLCLVGAGAVTLMYYTALGALLK